MAEFLILAALAADGPAAGEFPKAVRDRAEAATAKLTRADGSPASAVLVKVSGAHAYLLTAAHAVADEKAVEVQFAGGRPLAAEVLATAAGADVAVVRIAAAKGLPAPLPVAAADATPQRAVSVGWGDGAFPAVLDEELKGKVKLRRPGAAAAVWCWEAERKPAAGRSGGPLVDAAGAVAGVASGHDGRAGYYAHPEEVRAALKRNGLLWLTEK